MSSSISSSEHPSEQAWPGRYLVWLAVAATTALALVWLYVAVFPIAFLGGDFAVALSQRQKLAACDLGQVAIFGDSRAKAAIDPAFLATPAVNFALEGTTSVETWYAVQQAMRCPVPPRWVVIAHGMPSFTEQVSLWSQDGRYMSLNLEQLEEVERAAAALNDRGSLERAPDDGLSGRVRDWAYAVRFPPLFFASLKEAMIGLRWFHNNELLDQLDRSHGHVLFGDAKGSNEVTAEAAMRAFTARPLLDHYFSKTLALLAEHGVNVLYLAPPVNRSTHAQIRPEVGSDFLNYLRSKAKTFPGFKIAADVTPCWPDALFSDGPHLNGIGSREYSLAVNDLLGESLAGGTVGTQADHCQRRAIAP